MTVFAEKKFSTENWHYKTCTITLGHKVMCCGGYAVASAASVSQQYRMAHLASIAEVLTEVLAALSLTPTLTLTLIVILIIYTKANPRSINFL